MAKSSRSSAPKPDAPRVQSTAIGTFKDELAVEYIKPRDLFNDKTVFYVQDAFVRRSNRFSKDELVLEIVTEDGESGFLTLAHSPRREKFMRIVKSKGTIGPLVMTQGEDASQGNPAWCFADPNNPKEMF